MNPTLEITEEVLIATAGNEYFGAPIFAMLHERNPDLEITEAVMVAAVSDTSRGNYLVNIEFLFRTFENLDNSSLLFVFLPISGFRPDHGTMDSRIASFYLPTSPHRPQSVIHILANLLHAASLSLYSVWLILSDCYYIRCSFPLRSPSRTVRNQKPCGKLDATGASTSWGIVLVPVLDFAMRGGKILGCYGQ